MRRRDAQHRRASQFACLVLVIKRLANLLNYELARADAASADVQVRRQPPKGPPVTGLMKFVPPGAWAIWAQKPEFCESNALRYVATAMHKNLAKD